MDFLKKVAAPKWFIEANDLHVKLFHEQEKILGKDLIKEFKKLEKKGLDPKTEIGELMKMAGDLTIKGKMPEIEVQRKVAMIQNYSSLAQDLAWARFRYENKDNDFGSASTLKYNDKRKIIEIVK